VRGQGRGPAGRGVMDRDHRGAVRAGHDQRPPGCPRDQRRHRDDGRAEQQRRPPRVLAVLAPVAGRQPGPHPADCRHGPSPARSPPARDHLSAASVPVRVRGSRAPASTWACPTSRTAPPPAGSGSAPAGPRRPRRPDYRAARGGPARRACPAAARRGRGSSRAAGRVERGRGESPWGTVSVSASLSGSSLAGRSGTCRGSRTARHGALVRGCWSAPVARRISRLLSGLRTARSSRIRCCLPPCGVTQ